MNQSNGKVIVYQGREDIIIVYVLMVLLFRRKDVISLTSI